MVCLDKTFEWLNTVQNHFKNNLLFEVKTILNSANYSNGGTKKLETQEPDKLAMQINRKLCPPNHTMI